MQVILCREKSSSHLYAIKILKKEVSTIYYHSFQCITIYFHLLPFMTIFVYWLPFIKILKNDARTNHPLISVVIFIHTFCSICAWIMKINSSNIINKQVQDGIETLVVLIQVIIKKDEVEHTMTENRVLQTTRHPFLIVSLSF